MIGYVYQEWVTSKPRGSSRRFSRVFAVAAVDSAVIQEALQSPLPDFEDAVTAAAARLQVVNVS
jgi:hypothetical protein